MRLGAIGVSARPSRWRRLAAVCLGGSLSLTAAAVAAPAVAAGSQSAHVRPAVPHASQKDDELYAISCTKTKGCLAVGKWFSSKAKATYPLAETSTGSSWVMHNPPVPSGATVTVLHGVSCVSKPSPECIAVGEWGTLSPPTMNNYAALWNWSSWKLLKISDVKSSDLNELYAVSCLSSSWCAATGQYVPGSVDHEEAESQFWNGSSWTYKATVEPPPIDEPWLYGVSCTSPKFCLAVGDDTDTSNPSVQPTLAEVWNGSSWKERPSQNPAKSSGDVLAGVACLSTKSCDAAGYYLTPAFAFGASAESWNGKSLTLKPVPQVAPPSSGGPQLRGVACLSGSDCMAVGDLAAKWNGSSWVSEAFPQPNPIESLAWGISCVSANDCTAAGSWLTTSGDSFTFLVKWNGTSWTQQTGQNP